VREMGREREEREIETEILSEKERERVGRER
jgi:hypothetical protein